MAVYLRRYQVHPLVFGSFDGVIAEKNVVKGDFVDSTLDLFKVANIDRLAVWAHAYEEDLPALQEYEKELQAQGKAVPWKIRLRNDAGFVPVEGKVTRIGLIVDPGQHSVIVEGSPAEIRANQLVHDLYLGSYGEEDRAS